MSIKLNKESHITLIENDIAMVETHLPDCMERNHIEAVLRDPVNHYHPKCNKEERPSQKENSLPINNSRIIKFRGKRLFNGEWAEGSYIQPDGIIVLDEGEEVEVDPDTVGQFTGLLDKNGKEIYEGDVITWTDSDGNKRRDIVEWMNGGLCLCNSQYTVGSYIALVVIGNVVDNPELLKGEKE